MWNNFFVVSFFFRIFALFLKIIGIMKKIFLLMVASVLCVAGVKAEQTSLVATLSHDGNLSAFYGEGALKEAYNAAKEGDIITLSAGSFTGVNMSKNITLRGVGGWPDAKTDNTYTSIGGSGLTFKLQNNDYELKIEGVRFLNKVSLESDVSKECTLSKVYFSYSSYDYSLLVERNVYAKINNCYTWGHLSIYKGVCTNSCFRGVSAGEGTAPITFQNCVIHEWHSYGSNIGLNTYTEDVLTNCIFITEGDTYIKAGNDVHNCVAFSLNKSNSNVFANVTNSTNKMVEDRENFFMSKSLVTTVTDKYGDVSSYSVAYALLSNTGTGLYELSDDAKALYKGNDGTVVGLWGGIMPFSMTPVNPRISKCEIVPRVDKDGKLSVTIEVAQ
ncbi:MAG: hypothetical protein IJ533_02250 [Prevotella sp.]|nr:hypothetical protein [Prevotella sp.]